MHGILPIYSPYGASIFVPVFLAAAVWTVTLKGFALWYSARGGQKWWYVILLIVNTLGILEIIYLIWFRPKSFELEKETPSHSSSAPAN
ncbi:MAG TPA: DUF5652 family protein [Candidatus Paceibacterota bacterium]|nr:DUF5652 family protein [Candidatus Paceibacterota bacterium]